MNKILWTLLSVLCAAACMFGVVMCVMAVRFGEWGRVLFYGMIAVFSLEFAILCILKAKRKLDK